MDLSSIAVKLVKFCCMVEFKDLAASVTKPNNDFNFYTTNLYLKTADGEDVSSTGIDSTFSLSIVKAVAELGERLLIRINKIPSTTGIAGGLVTNNVKERAFYEFTERSLQLILLNNKLPLSLYFSNELLEIYTANIKGEYFCLFGFFKKGDYVNFTSSFGTNINLVEENICTTLLAASQCDTYSYDVEFIQKMFIAKSFCKNLTGDPIILDAIRYQKTKLDSPFRFFKYYRCY